MKKIAVFLIMFLLCNPVLSQDYDGEDSPSSGSALNVNEKIRDNIELMDSFHEVGSIYQFSSLPSADGSNNGGVHLLALRGSAALWPRLHLLADIPLFLGTGGPAGDGMVLGNSRITLRTRLVENLSREYPHFVYFSGYLQLPRKSSHPLAVNRTDLGISAAVKKIFYRFTLSSDLGWVARLDPSNSKRDYGNLISTGIQADWQWDIPILVSAGLVWRHAWDLKENGKSTDRQAVMTFKPAVRWEILQGVFLDMSVAFPMRSGGLGKVAQVFGDYESEGLWGTTWQTAFHYTF